MKSSQKKNTVIRIAVVDSDPLRFVGFRALLRSESDFDLQSVSLTEVGTHQGVQVTLLGSHPGRNVIELLTTMKTRCPGLKIIVTGYNMDHATILRMVIAGAKGCVEESASPSELARAIRMVLNGSVWVPRRVLAMFVEKAYKFGGNGISVGEPTLTIREKEVLRMLVAGCSNKEIAAPLGIEERTAYEKGWCTESCHAVGTCCYPFACPV